MSQRPTFHDYMRAYHDDHQHPANRLTHLVGIPLILASLPVFPFAPRSALKLFGVGWAIQFAGHFFEGKKPSFTRDARYLAVGPVWIMVEWVELLTGVRMYNPPGAESANGAAHDTAATHEAAGSA